jgi:hypothetical protein
MSGNVVATRPIRVDGKDYASLDEVPADKRDAVATAIASPPQEKLTANGSEQAGGDEVPATLRGLVESALSAAATARIPEKHPDAPVQVEPVTPLRTIIVGAGVILLIALVARFVL